MARAARTAPTVEIATLVYATGHGTIRRCRRGAPAVK